MQTKPYFKELNNRARSKAQARVSYYFLLLFADAVLIFCSLAASSKAYLGGQFVPYPLESGLLIPAYAAIAVQRNVYSRRALEDLKFAVVNSYKALFYAAIMLVIALFYLKESEIFSRVIFTLGLGTSAFSLLLVRFILRGSIKKRWKGVVVNTLIIDAGGPRVVVQEGVYRSASVDELHPSPSDPFSLDRLGRSMVNMDRIIVSCPAEDRILWAQALRAAGVRGEIVTDRLNELSPVGLSVQEGWHGLIVSLGPLGMSQRFMKRLFDVILSIVGIIIFSPIFICAAIAIKIEDGGPIFFVQTRLGLGNRFFRMLKFRSMRSETSDATGRRSASRYDDRITRMGALLRRTSIDELPQLFNVLRGDMSMVGPRPHALGSQAGDRLFWDIDQLYWHRHALKPGITGLAQVRGFRGATLEEKDLTDRLRSDLEYIRTWSLLKDVIIIIRTVLVVVHPRAF